MSDHIPKRKIQEAFDKESGEIIKATTLDDSLYAKHSRKRNNNKSDEFFCLVCEGELGIMPNNRNKDSSTYFFYHKHNYSNCDLVNGKLSNDEVGKLSKIFQSKESPRHKELKQLISEKLCTVDAVDKKSIKIEKWIFESEKLQKRPDVFCIYNGHKVAFEVQVSELSQVYMLERYNFYKQQQIHLIWIVDQFNYEKNRQFIRDIQELNNYENTFRLNENSAKLEFICNYPKLSINKVPEVIECTAEEIVPFINLSFDNHYQVFFYDYPSELRHFLKEKDEIKKENELRKIRKENEKRLQEEQQIKAEESFWQNSWLSRVEKINKISNNSNLYLTEHCYFHITPNEKLIVLFPEKRISKGEISEIERNNNSSLMWVTNCERSFKKGEIRSKVTVLLNDLENSFPKKERENLKVEFDDEERNFEFKLNNKKSEIERSKDNFKKSQGNLSSIVEIRNEYIDSVKCIDYKMSYFLKRSLDDNFKEKIQQLEKGNKDFVTEIRKIDQKLKLINELEDAEINGKSLKVLSKNPEKNELKTYFSNFTIVKKETYKKLFPEIIPFDRLSYVLYRPDDYVYLYDFTSKIYDLELSKGKLQNLYSLNLKELESLKEKIDKVVEDFFLEETNSLTIKIKELEADLELLEAELKDKKESYLSRIQIFDEEEKSIMINNKGYYYFDWNEIVEKWKDRKYPVFLDTNEGHLFWVYDEFHLKKVTYSDFISKLGNIRNTLKKNQS